MKHPWQANNFHRISFSWMLSLLLLTVPVVVQAQFSYTTNKGTITITGYTGPGGAVTIPDAINGLPVTSIGNYALSWTSLTSVTIPNSVTRIEGDAFAYCHSLAVVTIPNSVTNIEDGAFNECSSLTSVTIPNSVISIGDSAFWNCTSLTSVTIGHGVTSIGVYAFYGCTNLTALTVDPLNSVYSSADGVLFNKSQTTLIQCPQGKAGSYTIPTSVTIIGLAAFDQCTRLTSVTIPDTVTSIGSGAFHECTRLTNVVIPDSVTNIASLAFGYCTSMSSVTIGHSVTCIGNGAFDSCDALTSITIPNSVISIESHAFFLCGGLSSAIIGNGVTAIGDDAFANCSGLTSVYFQGNAPSFGEDVFCFRFSQPPPLPPIIVWDPATLYYLPGTTGWSTNSSHRPTALWALPNPLIVNFGPSFGVKTNQFGFIISWATNASVVVEACTNLQNPIWFPLQTNTLVDDLVYFADPGWTNCPSRFYRIRWP